MAKRKAAGRAGSARTRRKTQATSRPAARRPASKANSGSSRRAAARPAGRTAGRKAADPRPARKAADPGRARRTTKENRKANGARSAPASSGRSPKPKAGAKTDVQAKAPRIFRERRRLDETVPTPPSSLNMNRRGSAARTGRAEIEQERREHAPMTPAITGGDVDADWETAYFSGDEAPGGDNPTPDQDVVDDIGKALGVEYQDSEELKSSDKISERDKHRWELDPASSEDYKERD